MDQKLQKPVFLIAICRQSGDLWLSKTLFLTFVVYVVDSIDVLDCRLSGVVSLHAS